MEQGGQDQSGVGGVGSYAEACQHWQGRINRPPHIRRTAGSGSVVGAGLPARDGKRGPPSSSRAGVISLHARRFLLHSSYTLDSCHPSLMPCSRFPVSSASVRLIPFQYPQQEGHGDIFLPRFGTHEPTHIVHGVPRPTSCLFSSAFFLYQLSTVVSACTPTSCKNHNA